MNYETEIRNSGGRNLDVVVAWEVYAITLAAMMIYSLVSSLA